MKKRICSLLLTTVLVLLCACAGGRTTAAPAPSKSTPSSPAAASKPTPSYEPLEELTGTAVLSPDAYGEFCTDLKGLQIDYELFDLVDMDEALARYSAIQLPKETGSSFIKNGVVDAEALWTQVVKNNETFLADCPSKYDALSQADLDAVFQALVKGLNTHLANGLDPARLNAKLRELKLVHYNLSFGIAVAEPNYLLGFDTENIQARDTLSYEIWLADTTIHEGNHLCQMFTKQEEETIGCTGLSGLGYRWEDFETMPLYWKWYFEGSAEQLAYTQMGLDEPLSYANYVKFLELMTPAFLLRDGAEPDTMAKLSLQPKLEALFDAMGFREEEYVEAIQMMYAVDIVLTQKGEFGKAYKAAYSEVYSYMAHENALQSAAAQTLAKLFYRNLGEFLQGREDISIQELFSLISQFEVAMRAFTRYTSIPKDTQTFIEGYQLIQRRFFEALAHQTDMDAEKLAAQFAVFHKNEASSDLFLPHLPKEKQAYVQTFVEKYDSYGKIAICMVTT